MKKLFLLSLFVFLFVISFTQTRVNRIIAFYNLENLFDTIVDPDTNLQAREDFTPFGPKNWNTEKYYKKLDNIARVLAELGVELDNGGASVIGVAEVENKSVLEDLIKRPAIAGRKYEIVHFDSPDERGVDVAFLYRPDVFVLEKSWVRHETSLAKNDKTRDMLVIEGLFDGEKMYFMVDHWPSRSGGQKRSEPSRDSVAKHDRQVVDSILKVNPNAKIVYMGDLNDDPINKSVSTFFKAKGEKDKLAEGDMYNTMYDYFKSGNGTLAYNDAWNLFDQLIISQGLLKSPITSYRFEKSFIFKRKYMMQSEGRFEGYPLRTFVGDQFMGGYSDHFPVYLMISKEK